jgi:hypothetical protein
MGDAKRRKDMGHKPDPTDPQKQQKKRVMARAASEPIRQGFSPDLGRALAADGRDSARVELHAVQATHYQPLPHEAGICMQVVPSMLICKPMPTRIYEGYILSIECLSSAPDEEIAQYVKQRLAEGVDLLVGYDRAYESSVEYVVPLVMEYTP